ncbi:MAG TPA: T9SS type A sorting domain-containing protein, partial [Chitinophagales bacterium]|nr:T9SS type A sorting domain-containing protein [Chitinophagales bacterium]
ITSWYSQASCVHFGFTTNDEMQLFYYMYTKRLPASTATNDVAASGFDFSVVPNPMSGNGKLVYTLSQNVKVSASIIDVTGKVVAELGQEDQVMGAHTIQISDQYNLPAGIYIARLIVDGTPYTRKFIVTN